MDPRANQSSSAARPSLRRRLFWLLACTVLGLGVGLIGNRLTGDPRWFLALPLALAAGWLFFANPAACQSGQNCRRE